MIRIAGSTRLTTSAAKTVLYEGSYAIRRSVIQLRRRAHAASVPSDFPKPPKARKRVPIVERRLLVESYVNKYRETHAGKFPTIEDTRKEVGGSFYVVRKIIQELEHKSKVAPAISEIEIPGPKKSAKESESFTGVESTSTEVVRVDTNIGGASENFVEVEAVLQTSEKMLSEEVIETKVQENSDLARTQPNMMEGNTKVMHHRSPEKSDEVKEIQSDNLNSVMANENMLKKETDDQHSERPDILKNISHSKEADDQHSERPETLKNICHSSEANDQHLERPEILKNISHSKEADDQHSERPEILKNISHSKEADGQHSERPEILNNISHSYAESNGEDKKEDFVSGVIKGPDNPKDKEELPEQDKHLQDISHKQTNETEHSKESAIWRNLKSFADGIANFWRKL